MTLGARASASGLQRFDDGQWNFCFAYLCATWGIKGQTDGSRLVADLAVLQADRQLATPRRSYAPRPSFFARQAGASRVSMPSLVSRVDVAFAQ